MLYYDPSLFVIFFFGSEAKFILSSVVCRQTFRDTPEMAPVLYYKSYKRTSNILIHFSLNSQTVSSNLLNAKFASKLD